MTYEEYENQIKELFMECGYTEEENAEYFATEKVLEYIHESYGYVGDDHMDAGVTPEAVASTLDLMY